MRASGDNCFVIGEIPVCAHMEQESAWEDFIGAPGDWDTFERADFAMMVFIAKWQAYALSRRVAAARER